MSVHLVGAIVNQAIVETLGWVLLHSVWQLFVVALLVWFIERSLRRVSSSSRYVLQLVALLVMSVCPVVTWWKMEPAVPGSIAVALSSGEGVAFLPSEEDATDSAALPAGFTANAQASGHTKEAARQPAHKSTGWRDQLFSILRPWLRTMVAAWSFGVLVFSLRPIAGWVSVYRLRSRGASVAPEFVREKLQALCETLQVRRHVDVLVSTLVSSPVVIGCYRSLILLPASFATSVPVSQLEAILAHELAHVKRYDYFTNLIQTLMETLFFYHPAVWWLSSRIRIERENCCDDLVVTALNNHLDYGKALLAVEEYRTHSAVLALNARGGSLLARVRRILSVPADDAGHGSASILVLVCLLTCLVAGLSWSAAVAGNDEAATVAKDEKAAKEPAKATQSVPSESPPISASLTENLSVELLAIHEHWKTKADNGKHTVAPAPVWRGDGEVYAAPPQLPEWYDGSPQYAEGTRHVLFQCRGLSAGQQVACRGDEIKSFLYPDESGIVRAIVEPLGSPNTASFRVGVTDVEWGPWVKVDLDGEEQEDVEIPAACRDVYNRIGVSHVSLVGNESRFAWIGLKGVDDTAQSDLVAVDKSGKRHDPVAGTFEGSPPRHLSVDIFNIPREQLDHFEFRLRPYRYWVTFDDVSLKPEQKSSPKVTVKTVPIAEPISAVPQVGYGHGLLIGEHGDRQETRWTVELPRVDSVSEFAAMLEDLGIQLGAVDPKKRETLYLEDITAERPKIRVAADVEGENRSFMYFHTLASEKPDHDLFRNAGRDTSGMTILYFVSEETEQKLLALQNDAMAKFPQSRARRVTFQVSRNADQYTLSVVRVLPISIRDLASPLDAVSISKLFVRPEDLAQTLADLKKTAAEKDQPIAIMVATPDSEQARWFHALLRGTAEDREGIVIDDESLKAIRDGIRKCRVLWLDAAQLEELKKLIPDHELEEKHDSAMVFLKPDGTWLCYFEPDPKNEPERSVKNLMSAIQYTAKAE